MRFLASENPMRWESYDALPIVSTSYALGAIGCADDRKRIIY